MVAFFLASCLMFIVMNAPQATKNIHKIFEVKSMVFSQQMGYTCSIHFTEVSAIRYALHSKSSFGKV